LDSSSAPIVTHGAGSIPLGAGGCAAHQVQNYFLMPDLELKPPVSSSEQYWIQLTMRYVVAAGKQLDFLAG